MSASLTDTSILAGASQPSGYNIDKSCRFNQGDTPYLAKTMTSAGDRKKWTASFWYKRSVSASTDNPLAAIDGTLAFSNIQFASDMVQMEHYPGTTSAKLRTTRLFRDPSSWYHIVMNSDTTLATADDRMKIYVNGVQETDFAIRTNPAQNMDWYFNDGSSDLEVSRLTTHGQYLDGYLAEFHYIDGQALTPSDFAETDDLTNEWKAIEYTGTYGTNGFYLDFSNSAALGTDSSGNGNDMTVSNLAADDQMIDTPQNSTGGNFSTLNPLIKPRVGTSSYRQGNLQIVQNNWDVVTNTMFMSSGKWYWEVLANDDPPDSWKAGIIAGDIAGGQVGSNAHDLNGTITYQGTNGSKTVDGTVTTYGSAIANGTIVGVALDLDSGTKTVTFYNDNTSQGALNLSLSSVLNASSTVATLSAIAGNQSAIYNFGQDSTFAARKTAQGNSDGNDCGDFYYTPPAGYLALCTNNLPDPAIALPGEHFNSILYTGDGGTDQAQTGVGFQPDLVWGKAFVDNKPPWLFDVIRGTGKLIESSSSGAETSPTDMLNSFDSDGFTHGNQSAIGGNGNNYIAWNWKAGGAASSNTDGSITSSVSVNTTAGFSIFSFTGTGAAGTVGHGLPSTPDMMIFKGRNTTSSWPVYYDVSGGTLGFPLLESANANVTSSSPFTWNSSVFTFTSSSSYSNTSGTNYIAYAFQSIDGYSKVGKYTGDGTTNGAFIYTGFEPKFLMCKKTNGSGGWAMIDRVRYPNNVVRNKLWANLNDGVVTAEDIVDFNSNGFKWRIGDSTFNGDNDSYIFIAMAQNPFKYGRAV